jgi:hypothetical protein
MILEPAPSIGDHRSIPPLLLPEYTPSPLGGGLPVLELGLWVTASSSQDQAHMHPLPQVRVLWVLGRGQLATSVWRNAIP